MFWLIIQFVIASGIGVVIALYNFFQSKDAILYNAYATMYENYKLAVPAKDDEYNIRNIHKESEDKTDTIPLNNSDSHFLTIAIGLLYAFVIAGTMAYDIIPAISGAKILTCLFSYVIARVIIISVFKSKNFYFQLAKKQPLPSTEIWRVGTILSTYRFVRKKYPNGDVLLIYGAILILAYFMFL